MGLGCGNPQAIAPKRRRTVLELDPGRVRRIFGCTKGWAEWKVYGVDMTPEMLSKARKMAATSGHHNVEFLWER